MFASCGHSAAVQPRRSTTGTLEGALAHPPWAVDRGTMLGRSTEAGGLIGAAPRKEAWQPSRGVRNGQWVARLRARKRPISARWEHLGAVSYTYRNVEARLAGDRPRGDSAHWQPLPERGAERPSPRGGPATRAATRPRNMYSRDAAEKRSPSYPSLYSVLTERVSARHVNSRGLVIIRDLGVRTAHRRSCNLIHQIVGSLSPQGAQATDDGRYSNSYKTVF
jgi:hypothetical protein